MARNSTARRLVGLLGIAVVIVTGMLSWSHRPEPVDTRFTGAYTMSDGTQVFITPNADASLRYRLMNGETGVVWPVEGNRYAGGSGWEVREPITNTMSFTMHAEGRAVGLEWKRSEGRAPTTLSRIDLPERIVEFASGSLVLRAKFVRPEGDGPFPTIVIVPGGERTGAVDFYPEPYVYAANGFAALVLDKRGTGESEGGYTQNFSVLADDVLAAIAWLRRQDHIHDDRINLVGCSQGGWVAPLVAMRDGHIRSMVICYGPLVSVVEEDRWGYVDALQKHGFGADAVSKADRINAVLEDITTRGTDRWDELTALLDEARHEPWAKAAAGSDSFLGSMLATRDPKWVSRLRYWWHVGRHTDPPFIEYSYDPVPTTAALTIPSMWIFGGDDSSMPTEWTLDEIAKLQADGKPVETKVYPHAEHGMLRFEGGEGQRRAVGWEPDYFPFQIDWLKRQNTN